MHESERIFKQIVATGREWKGCSHCGKRFEVGEILTAVQIYTGMVIFWECSQCTDEWLGPYDDELKLQPPPVPPEFVLVKLNPETQTFETFDGKKIAVLKNAGQVSRASDRMQRDETGFIL